MSSLHIFDMDGTLVDNDCDLSWKVFLVDVGIAPRTDLELAQKYYEDYDAGLLDFEEFLHFQLREFVGKTEAEMAELCQRHFDTVVRPKCRPGAFDAVRNAQKTGAVTTILSSTNTMISEPVRAHFGIDRTHGTTLEVDAAGRFTGNIVGPYALGKNKVAIMQTIAAGLGLTPDQVCAYGDSNNDIPLLSAVGSAFVIAPSPELRAEAAKHHWPILNW